MEIVACPGWAAEAATDRIRRRLMTASIAPERIEQGPDLQHVSSCPVVTEDSGHPHTRTCLDVYACCFYDSTWMHLTAITSMEKWKRSFCCVSLPSAESATLFRVVTYYMPQ
eukprot:TRINITY_DN3157_c0_g1_i3.p1 TRINITY_DN3157_c0_g1~~TRINITY_DN3157_c0_g1_i3.p1  ORF type:complete len:112 (-),score=6.46 TRINITY_DN3157_c0_g1_i3:120-455(-)